MTAQAAAAKQTTPAATKPSLSEQQRQGAIERAKEASDHSAKVAAAAAEAKHSKLALIQQAAKDAAAAHTEAKLAGSVADAQFHSRAAIEADAATGWLWKQK